jgi:hypothetical protein
LAVFLGAYLSLRHSRFGSCVAYAMGGFRALATDRARGFDNSGTYEVYARGQESPPGEKSFARDEIEIANPRKFCQI